MKTVLSLLALAVISTLSLAQVATPGDAVEPVPTHARPLEYPTHTEKHPTDYLEDVVAKVGYGGRTACLNEDLPLGIVFSNYTIDANGFIIQDGGWTQGERDVYRGFICKMMPVLVQLYGLPYERYDLTIIRDRRYVTSNIFVPTERSIRTSGYYWSPQLLTHELIHAFRGDWHLTRSTNSGNYSPTLSGFEEGFAQAVSYDAMNAYIDLYGLDVYVNRNLIWSPDTEWDYDFRNDNSMVTEDFWSEEGGTNKFYERYEQAAAAIQQLNVRIPNFYLRFNETYYQRARLIPGYQPTRADIIDIIDTLTHDPDIRQWIDRQEILDCRTIFGKKIYTTSDQGSYLFGWHRIHFVETFPNKNEWYYFVPGQGYLYNRLNYYLGRLSVYRSWNNTAYTTNQILNIKDLVGWGNEQACGVNCSKGFGADDLLFYFGSTPPVIPRFNNPLMLRQPPQPGLYWLYMTFNNPNFNMTPEYGIWYDRIQPTAAESKYELLGFNPDTWNNNRIFGGVLNLPDGLGYAVITHSMFPFSPFVTTIANGAFTTTGLSDWFQTMRGVTVMRPGVLTFEIQDTKGRSHTEKRYVTYGNHGGKHKFLFTIPITPNKAPATGPS